jgi:hypothetical protein
MIERERERESGMMRERDNGRGRECKKDNDSIVKY